MRSRGLTVKNSIRLVVVLTVASLLLVGPASAHVREATTHLKLRANPTQVKPGGVVRFTIRLNSQWNNCKANQPVRWYRNGVYIRTLTTNSHGKIVLNKHVRATSRYYAKYLEHKWGTHPHRHVCHGSRSNAIRIRVKSGS